MGVPINTLLNFLLYKILLYGPVSGLPFASISSLTTPGFTSIEETTPESSLSSYVPNLVNIEALISSPSAPGTSATNNFQLFVGLPIGDTNYFLSQNPCLTENIKDDINFSPNIASTTLSPSSNIQLNYVLSNPGSESSSSYNDGILNINPHEPTTSTSTPGVSIVPIVNFDINTNNLKRELRDTTSVSQEPCLSMTQQNLLASSPICASNVPSSQISPLFSKFKPITQTKFINLECNSVELDQLSNEDECDYVSANPYKTSTFLTNISPGTASLQGNTICPQENLNMLLAQNILSNGVDKQSSEVGCSESNEIITLQEPSRTMQSCCNTNTFKGPSNTETNLSPAQMNRLNNNFLNAQALQNKKIPSMSLQKDNANCENTLNQNKDLISEYENVLRIRNSVIPKMLSNNYLVKTKNALKNNDDDNQGCPQLETISVQNNTPFIQCNNIFLKPTNYDSNIDNMALVAKNKLNDENSSVNVQNNKNRGCNNNNQGCPQLTSIPVYNKESLLNKIRQSSSNNDSPCQNDNVNLTPASQSNNVNFNNQNRFRFNQNVQGCPQLLSIAQNNLYSKENDVNNNVQDFECGNQLVENVDCNCIQAITSNDNLAQALKLVNRAKNTRNPPATINILPYGETLLDGQPINNNLITIESISNPGQLPTCTCSNLCNCNKFLTVQDVSSIPFPVSPVEPFSCCTSLGNSGISTNFMMAPSFNPLNTVSSIVSNFAPPVCNFAPSVPTIPAITNTELPVSIPNPSLIFSQETSCNNNIQPMFTLLQTPNAMNPISPDFIPVQSLPQVSFGNNCVGPSSSFPNSCFSSISNIPSICTASQPVICPAFPLTSTNLQQANSVSGASAVFPSLNNIVSSLTQNIISTLMSKTTPCSSQPLAKLPPVNPFTPQVITETSPCLDISKPSNCIISSPLSMSGLSVTNIPVACNEYLPPIYNSAIIPVSTFNSNLFCVESDTAIDSCSPFALSKTDAYYPELSYLLPSVGSSDSSCLCGPLFMPASSLPQSSSVIKINNTGREAKGYEQLIKTIII